jgi:hypothetical protein
MRETDRSREMERKKMRKIETEVWKGRKSER